MKLNHKPGRFLMRIYKIGIVRYVDVPEEVSAVLAKAYGNGFGKGHKRKPPIHVPVVAMVNGCSARTTIVPAGAGRYRLALNTSLRKAARADAGDIVGVTLKLDRGSRRVEVPADLRTALRKHPTARRRFEELPPGHRRQFLLWFASAKTPETRQRHVDKDIDHLAERVLLLPPTRSGQRKARPRVP
jgi:hypothetical protein